jgi:hypothetical protein
MGKAVIVSEQGEGRYTIKKEVSGLASARALAADRRERMEAEFPPLRLEEEEAVNAVVYQRFVTDTLLDDWLAGIEIPEDTLNFELRYGITDEARAYVQAQASGLEVPAALMNAIHELVEKRMILDDIRRQIDRKSAEYVAVLKWQGELTALQNSADTPIPAWCANYTQYMTGEVATLEVPGEVDPTIGGGINIKPGDGINGGADWSARYGQIQLGKTLSPAGFAWNLTMIQPWMKWLPLWRYATVTAVDTAENTVSVTLHPILSKARVWLRRDRSFNNPWIDRMTGVTVEYPCGAGVFETGDDVIIEFRYMGGDIMDLDNQRPYCIGFKSHPRPCESFFYSDQLYPSLEGIISGTAPITWRSAPASFWSGFFPTADGGMIIAEPGRKLTRYSSFAGTEEDIIWSITTDFEQNLNFSSYHNAVIVSSSRGIVRYINPVTGALVNQFNLPEDLTGDRICTGVCAAPDDGRLIYSLFNLYKKSDNVLKIGSSTYPMSGIYGGGDEFEFPGIESTTCAGDYVFIYVYDRSQSPNPGPHYIVQVTMSGQFVQVMKTPGQFPDLPTQQGNTVCAVSNGFRVPAMPPPPPEEEDPPP